MDRRTVGKKRYKVTTFFSFSKDEYANYLLEKKFTTNNINQNSISLDDIDKYVRSLQMSVETWYNIYNPKESDYPNDIQNWLDKINRIGFPRAAPLIMTFFQFEPNQSKRLEFLKAVERLIFSLLLMRIDYRLLDIEDIEFLRLAIELNNSKVTTDEVVRKLGETGTKFLHNKEGHYFLIKAFNEKGFYEWKGIRYFLFEYDLYLAENSKTDRKKLIWKEFANRDYETTEHIIHREQEKNVGLMFLISSLLSKGKKLKNSLGNLVPLSRRKNSAFQNKCFSEKVSMDNKSLGFRYGCYSENEITKYSEWTEKEILKRGLNLLNFMENRWDLKLGSENDKIKFLGLEFLNKKGDRQQKLKRQ
jgi:hypothetical protein